MGVAIGKIKFKQIPSIFADVDEDYKTRSCDKFVFTEMETLGPNAFNTNKGT